ncbi:MAG TPA: hypothetical protein VM077_02800 [Candidatus Limnocylindrales bacterium]|nr:hypothetical protein [Candidatus Limnocylindrales bacterium]
MSSGEGGGENDQKSQGESFVNKHSIQENQLSPHNPFRPDAIRGFDHFHKSKNADRHTGFRPREAAPATNIISSLEAQLGNETPVVPRFENSEQAMQKAIQDCLGLTQEELARVSPEDIKNKLKENPEAFKFEHLEDILDGNKNDVLDRQKEQDKLHPEKRVLREAADITQQFFWKHPKMDDAEEVYAVKREDGTWAIHTKKPDDDPSIPFSKNTLRDLRESLDLPTARMDTIDKIKAHVTAMKEGKKVSEDDKELVYGYAQAIIEDLIKISGLPSDQKRKGEINNYLELLYSYADRTEGYRGGIISRLSKRMNLGKKN